jgi:signal transduction histidine kinase
MQPKILIVDDRESNLLSFISVLEPCGYRCVKANSGRQALKILLSESDFTLILMDVKMPNLNGFETASLILERKKLKNIPIIFITASNYGDENTFKAYQLGAVDYIFKPINPDILRAKVNVLVDLHRKNRLLMEQEQKLIELNKNLEQEIRVRKASEDRVIQLYRQQLENVSILESSNKDLERFTFIASHDLQEPLRKIRLFTDMLYVKYKDIFQDDHKIITRILKAAEHMQTLISDILALSKVSAEKLEFEECDLNVLLNELLADMEDEIKRNKSTILVEPIPPLFVIPRLMRPLFQNLIGNALKFKKENEDSVIKIYSEVNTTINEEDTKNPIHKYCRIYVKDNGIGFDQKYSEDIFGMLKRLHKNGKYEGTGIGLAFCRKITELHKGFISANGVENEGATFVISLPLLTQREPSEELAIDQS